MLQDYISAKLKEFSDDVRALDKSLSQQKHGDIMKVLSEDGLDIRKAFHQIADNGNFVNDNTILNAVKDVSMIRLNEITSYDALDVKSLKVKPELIEFLAKYLSKRRATYLFIYMLFQKKHIELVKIKKLLGDKYDELQNMVLPPGAVPMPIVDVKEFLLQLQAALLNNIKDKSLNDKIAKIFNDVLVQSQSTLTIDYINSFNALGELINQIDSQTSGYQALVQDVIPLIARWNDNTL
jgi:hypothetical protein